MLNKVVILVVTELTPRCFIRVAPVSLPTRNIAKNTPGSVAKTPASWSIWAAELR
jgi:hypothetical protein